jgi:sugar phosphate isomerase/epimerase
MRVSISNIAWELDQEREIAQQLRVLGVDQVDVAPGKYFADPMAATADDIDTVRRLWEARGFSIAGMQALLFGTSGLNLFQDTEGVMFERLVAVARIGSGLGARGLTFGSPRQRDRSGLDDATAKSIAVDYFRRLGDRIADLGVKLCLEPNPVAYNCNFMTTTAEAADIVRAVDHPAIALQLDVGAIALNGEDAATTIADVAPLIGHIHASEPGLVTLGDGGSPHVAAAEAIARLRPELTVTIEMTASRTEPAAQAVARAVRLAQSTYGDA